jgi:multidrug efflux pump subunit AcrB
VFVTGIVVDASIIVVENMHRHFKMKKLPRYQAALASIDEVGNPDNIGNIYRNCFCITNGICKRINGTIYGSYAYWRSIAMMFSLLVALVVTPYVAYKSLGDEKPKKNEKKYVLTRYV